MRMKGRTDREAGRVGRGALIRCCCVIGNPLLCLPTKQSSVQSACLPTEKAQQQIQEEHLVLLPGHRPPQSQKVPCERWGERGTLEVSLG